jgi:hypothetical protein
MNESILVIFVIVLNWHSLNNSYIYPLNTRRHTHTHTHTHTNVLRIHIIIAKVSAKVLKGRTMLLTHLLVVPEELMWLLEEDGTL